MLNCFQMPGYPLVPLTQSTVEPGPPSEGALKIPVMSAPKMPPMACTPKTSSESSALMSLLSPVTPHRHTTPTPRPIANAPEMPTLPAAGVIATRPATAPEAAPSIDGLPFTIHSPAVHDNTAQAVAR